MSKLLKLALVLSLLPAYIYVMGSSFDIGDPCNVEDPERSFAGQSVSESVGICTEVSSRTEKKFFGLFWLPVYKWGMNVAQLHYFFFFAWAGATIYVFW